MRRFSRLVRLIREFLTHFLPLRDMGNCKNFAFNSCAFHAQGVPSIHPSMYLLAKCKHGANNNAIDNAKWITEQKRETLC